MKALMIKWFWILGLLCTTLSAAEDSIPLILPKPQLTDTTPLVQALKERKSTREFSNQKLPAQTLSNLLWAAFGVNRQETGGRTAPSTRNWQDIDIYVAADDGLYLFDAKTHSLKHVLSEDIRAQTGTQDFVADAPVNLILVSDFTRMDAGTSQEDRKIAAAIDAGLISQNIYLYCAATNLATVVRGSVDKEQLAKSMKLKPTQWIVVAQSVGYPKQPGH